MDISIWREMTKTSWVEEKKTNGQVSIVIGGKRNTRYKKNNEKGKLKFIGHLLQTPTDLYGNIFERRIIGQKTGGGARDSYKRS